MIASSKSGLRDTFSRQINYLRLSVTDRCNMRCIYCMPAEGIQNIGHAAVLSYEELQLIAEIAIDLGIGKIRVTGGEPLVRTGIVGFLGRLSTLPGLRHLVLTTNGMLLEQMAEELYQAGVQRLNVSIDSLNQATFSRITRGGELYRVLAGLDAADKAGFPPPKINVVIMRGVNDSEILDFAELTLNRGYAVRFIEYMPVVKQPEWQQLCFPGKDILRIISERHTLKTIDRGELAGPSEDYQIVGAKGTIGIITPVSGHFCNACNRIRITADGKAKGCLFSDDATDLKPFLRPPDRQGLSKILQDTVLAKPERHFICCDNYSHRNFSMARVGG
jgi:cyclic pyranopterin phosphate synthase